MPIGMDVVAKADERAAAAAARRLAEIFTGASNDISRGVSANLSRAFSGFDTRKARDEIYALQSAEAERARVAERAAGSVAVAERRATEAVAAHGAESSRALAAEMALADARARSTRDSRMAADAHKDVEEATKRSATAASSAAAIFNGVGVASVAAMGAAFYETGTKAAQFQRTQERLVTAAGETADGLKVVSDGLLTLAGQTGTSAQQLSQAMYWVESAGHHGADGVKVMTAAAQGAKAEQSDLKEVLNGLTTSMNDFGYGSAQAADVMSKMVAAVGLSKTNFQDFSGSLHSAEPLIANIGKSQALTSEQMHRLMADLYGLGAQMTQTGDSAEHSFQLIGHAASKMLGPTAQMRSMMGSLGLDAQEVTDHLGERGVTGTLQLLQQALKAHTKDGTVDIDVHYQSAQASRAEAEAFNALPGPAKAVAQEIKNGTLSYKEFRKSRGGLNVEQANEINQWNALNNKLTGYNDLIKSGIGSHISYDQALKILTGDQETLQVALQATVNDGKDVNDRIKQIDGTVREADGTVKGFNPTMDTAAAKWDKAKESFGAAAIKLGTELLPALTGAADGLAKVGNFLSEHKTLADAAMIAVGGFGTAWLAVKGYDIAKTVLHPIGVGIDFLKTKFGEEAIAAGTANAAMSQAGPSAEAGAIGVQAAATEEVAAEERVAVAAGEADAALAGGKGGLGGLARGVAPVAAGAAAGFAVPRANDFVRNQTRGSGALPGMSGDVPWYQDPTGAGIGAFMDAQNWLAKQTGLYDGHARGGAIHGRGPRGRDSVPAWLAPGEHVLTHHDVAAMGGQGAVYGFRHALHRAYGGAVGPDVQVAESMVGTHYSQGSRNDCSGMVGRVIKGALGVPGGALPTTQNMGQWLSALGFRPGIGPAGTISVGWYNHGSAPNDGHAAMTLSDGENAESGGSHGSFLVGAGAQGASSSQFDHHMFLPELFGEGGSTGMPGGGMFGGGGGGGGLFGGGGGGIPAGGVAGTGPGGQAGYYTQSPEKVAAAEERLRHLDAEIANAEKRKGEMKADAKQSERDRLDEEIRHLKEERDQEQGRLGEAKRGSFHAMRGGRGGRGGGGGMGGFGVPLPEGFGLGKGLPGLAEWLVDFVGDLAVAPLEGLMMSAMGGGDADLGMPFGAAALTSALGGAGGGPDLSALGGGGEDRGNDVGAAPGASGPGAGGGAPGAGGGPGQWWDSNWRPAPGAAGSPWAGAGGNSAYPWADYKAWYGPGDPRPPDASIPFGGGPGASGHAGIMTPAQQGDWGTVAWNWWQHNVSGGTSLVPKTPSQGGFGGRGGFEKVPGTVAGTGSANDAPFAGAGHPRHYSTGGPVGYFSGGDYITANTNGSGDPWGGPNGPYSSDAGSGAHGWLQSNMPDWWKKILDDANGKIPIDNAWMPNPTGPPIPPVPGQWTAPSHLQGPNGVSGSAFGGPKGTDTIPAWLSPGEFVMNANATRDNLPALQFMNAGHYDGGTPEPLQPAAPSPGAAAMLPKAPGPAGPGGPVGAGLSGAMSVHSGAPAPQAATPAGQTQAGAGLQAPGSSLPASPGLGISGGIIGAAEGAASSGADLMAPGSGAAMQIGMQEMNRAISAAGQYAAIGVQGLGEIFKVSGSGPGQDHSTTIPGRILAGISGVRPNGQNTAGNTLGAGGQSTPDQQQQQQPNIGMQVGQMHVHAQNPNDFANQMDVHTQSANHQYASSEGR